MESLYKLAVEGILSRDFSWEEFKKLPFGIQCDLIPQLYKEVNRLNKHIVMLMEENTRLHHLITSIKNQRELSNYY